MSWYNRIDSLLICRQNCYSFPDQSEEPGNQVLHQPLKLSRNRYNLRKLHEMPYHLIMSEQWQLLKEKVLCNYEWLEGKIKARSLG